MILSPAQLLNHRYEILSAIGSGGMGDVYKAFDRNLHKEVAVKVIRPGVFSDDAAARAALIQEGRRQAGLDHPHILPVTDADEDKATGLVYLVMRYVAGGTLAERLKSGPLPPVDAAKILSQIAAALDYVHAGPTPLIHRDLKPLNILFDQHGYALVTDFGLANLLTDPHQSDIKGTPLYMAPEQAAGEPLDIRADVYVLGVILFELLTGQTPFALAPGESTLALLHRVIADPPPALRSFNPALPTAVEPVIFKALAKKPADRYASAGELVAAFTEALADTAAAAVGTTTTRLRRAEPPPLSPPQTDAIIHDLRQAMNDLGQYCQSNLVTLKEAEVVHVAAPMFIALGYESTGGDLRLEQYVKGKRADVVLKAAGGHPLAVIEFKRPSRAPDDGLEQLEKLYVAKLLPDLGVLCNGLELWLARREGDHLADDWQKIKLATADDKAAMQVWQQLARRQLNLSDLESVKKALGWLTDPNRRLPVTAPDTPGGQAFLARFALSPATPFGLLVKEMAAILPAAIKASTFTQGAYSFWRQVYARQLESDETPVAWRPLQSGAGSEAIYHLMFALESAYAILARLLLAQTMENHGSPGLQLVATFRNQLENEQALSQIPPGAYAIVGHKLFEHAGKQAFAAIFASDIFDWWHDLPQTPGHDATAHALAEAILAVFQFDFSGLSGDLLGELYQTYFDADTRKALGEFYTPPEVVEFILDEVGYTTAAPGLTTRRLIDPSCGSGSFIVAALRRYLVAAHGHPPKDTLLNLLRGLKIVGLDVNPFAVLMSQINYAAHIVPLYKQVIETGYIPVGVTIPIFRADSLRREDKEAEQTGAGKQMQLRMVEEDALLVVRTELPVSTGKGDYAVVEIPIPRFDQARAAGLVGNPEEYFVALHSLFAAVAVKQTSLPALTNRLAALDLPQPEQLAIFIAPAATRLATELLRLQNEYSDGRFLKTMTDLALAVVLKNHFQYHAVVGNPPYVRIEQIPEILRRRWEGWYTWASGKFDIYIPFLERAVGDWLADEGRLGVICSNRFMLANYAGGVKQSGGKSTPWGLRAKLPEQAAIELLLDFRDSRVFKDALNYPAILVAAKSDDAPGPTVGVRVFKDPPDPNTGLATLLTEVSALAGQVRQGAEYAPGQFADALDVPSAAFTPAAWLLMPPAELAVFEKLEQAAAIAEVADNPVYRDKPAKDRPVHPYVIRLEDITATRSGGFQGVATGDDSSLILRQIEAAGDSKLRLAPKGAEVPDWNGPKQANIESAVLRPWLFGRDVERWHIAWDGWFVFFPYAVIEALERIPGTDNMQPVARYRLIPTTATEKLYRDKYHYQGDFPLLDRDYPLAWQYVTRPSIEKRLRERERGRFKAGKRDEHWWYAPSYPRSIDLYDKPKFLIQGLSPTNDAAMDDKKHYVFASSGAGQAYGLLPQTEHSSIQLLMALLNSKVLDFYLKHVSTVYTGKTYSYGDQFIKQLPIKLPLTVAEQAQAAAIAQFAANLTDLTGQLRAKEQTRRDFPQSFQPALVKYSVYPLRQLVKGAAESTYLNRANATFEAQPGGAVLLKFGKTELTLPDDSIRQVIEMWLTGQSRQSVSTADLLALRLPDTKKGRLELLAAVQQLDADIARLAGQIVALETQLNETVAAYYGLSPSDVAVIETFLARF